MKGKYVIIDLRDMECLKNENGEIDYFDTMEAACTACGMYELEGVWVMQLMYNHIPVVSQPRELLIDFYSKQNGGMNETNKYAIIREVDNYIESVEVGKAISELSEIADKEAEKFIEKYTTKDQNDWLVKKKDIIARFMESYHNERLRIANVSKSLPNEDAKFIYSLLPDWVKSKAPEGLYPTMYGTLSKEGVDEIQERVKQILGNVC